MTEAEMLLKAIDDNYGQTTPILMLADWNEENSMTDSASMLRSAVGWLGDGDGGGDGGCGGGGGGGGDGGGDGGCGGGGGGDGGGGGGWLGDGGGGGGGGGDGIKYILSRGYAMTVEGLYIICSPGGYYPYVRIGWCRRADSMIEMRCCRVIRRFGTDAQLAVIAKDGPISSTQLLDPSDVEYVSVGMVSRLIPCNEKKWRKECPKPATEYAEV